MQIKAVEILNETDFMEFDKDLLFSIHNHLTKRSIELVIVDNNMIKELNRKHRGIDKATDVLSFPFEPVPNAPLGAIVINKDKVIEAAKTYGHTPKEEFALLFIHGLLHLLGYDHEVDDGEMRKMEEELIHKYNLPDSLIVRTHKEE